MNYWSILILRLLQRADNGINLYTHSRELIAGLIYLLTVHCFMKLV